jgi:hypothetical protein
MRTKTILIAAALATVLLLAAGCGVGSSDEADISATTEAYLSALADGDFAAACDQLTEAARTETCAADLERAADAEPEGAFADKVDRGGSIEVSGERATMRLDGGGSLALEREAGSWRIASGYPR